jgi:hypothetical protein
MFSSLARCRTEQKRWFGGIGKYSNISSKWVFAMAKLEYEGSNWGAKTDHREEAKYQNWWIN